MLGTIKPYVNQWIMLNIVVEEKYKLIIQPEH